MRHFWRALGPGVITGAADDDPSGIATYSIAGAQFGTALLWLAPLTWPLMARGAVDVRPDRDGDGRGADGRPAHSSFRARCSRSPCLALLIANTINIGADLAGMADAAEMLTGVEFAPLGRRVRRR